MESRVTATVCDQIALSSIKTDTPLFIGFGTIVGGLGYYFLGQSIKESGMAVSNGYWNVLSTICGTLIGYFYWKEAIPMKNFIGLGLGCVSLYLMNGIE